jgi:hypothetical protein
MDTKDFLDALRKKNELTIDRRPNLACEACWQKRMHRPEEWAQFHPRAGEGIFPTVYINKEK